MNAQSCGVDPGSFRDPSGRVYIREGRVFRTVLPRAAPDYEFVRDTGLLERLAADGRAVASTPVAAEVLGAAAAGAAYVLEHPRLPFVSYPYEWSFGGLKAAALLHLDVHLEALKAGATLSDASAYNVQFLGPRPVFIDALSFRRYRDGEYWIGHRQFCEQFLNPLLLTALLGVPHNAWYRGSQEGVPTADLARLLPIRRKLSWNVLTHVVLPNALQSKAHLGDEADAAIAKGRLPHAAFKSMLSRLRTWIAQLEPVEHRRTVWGDYTDTHNYLAVEYEAKKRFVAEFATAVQPNIAWDLGCNAGDFSEVLLQAGAGYVIGFEFDQGALDAAFRRAQQRELSFLPLYLDVCNPTPSQGWNATERAGLRERGPADALIALALIHHIAIARNVPLDYVVEWIVSLAPHGVVEFVPKADPQTQRLLRRREDIFDSYHIEAFTAALDRRARIIRRQVITASGRELFWFDAS